MPHEMWLIKKTSPVLSRTGRLGRYQSGHAIIEKINKEAKRDLAGGPDESQWCRSFKNLDNMNYTPLKTFRDADVTDQKIHNLQKKT